jgi:predicted dehydrogenase
MLNRERPDIVVAASREISNHSRVVLDVAARAGHVYVEKPIAAAPAEVDEMVAACDAASRHLVVAHPWRGHQAIHSVALPALRPGLIGEPRVGRVLGMGGRHGGNELFIDLAPHVFITPVCREPWRAPAAPASLCISTT